MMLPLTDEQRRRLVEILVTYAQLGTELRRQNFLEDAGVINLYARLTPESTPQECAWELIWLLNHPATVDAKGQPAFRTFLESVRDHVVPGHAEHVAFINEILNQPSGSIHASPPPQQTPVSTSNLSPVTRKPRITKQMREQAEAQADRLFKIGAAIFALLILGVVVAILLLGWDVMEPVTYIIGAAVTLAAIGFFVMTRAELSLSGIYDWLVTRELKRLSGDQPDEEDDNDDDPPPPVTPHPLPYSSASAQITADPRTAELAFLERRKNAESEFASIEQYTPLKGKGKVRPTTKGYAQIRTKFQHRPEMARLAEQMMELVPREPRTYDNILEAVYNVRRAVLLGEPGGGKTTTLRTIELHAIQKAADSAAPIPLFVRLNEWRDKKQTLVDFIKAQLGDFGFRFRDLLTEKRAMLLLDGFNEIPVQQREKKGDQIVELFTQNPDLICILSCRELDYTLDLGFDKLVITPLHPLQVLDFAERTLDKEGGEKFFWAVAGGEEVRKVWLAWQKAGATLSFFWDTLEIPKENPNVWNETTRQQNTLWQNHIRDRHGSLMELAQNPYMLVMLMTVYGTTNDLPPNRGKLFERFVEKLLSREGLAKEEQRTAQGDALHAALIQLAFEMQVNRAKRGENSALVTLPLKEVVPKWLTADQIKEGIRANLLVQEGDSVRFSHQLLQEYFAALAMQSRIKATRNPLRAEQIWPRNIWWERTNWEEATVLLAGLYSNDCSEVIDWVGDANPEVAAQCILRSGANAPPETLGKWQSVWLKRLTDVNGEPDPRSRAGVGRALGGLDVDNRPGVGLRADGLPDITWCYVPDEGKVTIGGDEAAYSPLPQQEVSIAPFYMATYPITYKQFQAFIDAGQEGYFNKQWWQGLTKQETAPGEQYFKYWNHPRDTVSWYDMVAFCRWLTAHYKAVAPAMLANAALSATERDRWEGLARGHYTIRLATEQEWEKAARGKEQRLFAYGNEFDPKEANIDKTEIKMTNAVGIFPHALSPYGVAEMSGNVWEWTLSAWDTEEQKQENLVTLHNIQAARVWRGGSWFSGRQFSRAASRYDPHLFNRASNAGGRVVCASAPRGSVL